MGSPRSDSVGSVSSSRDVPSQAGEPCVRLMPMEPPPKRVLGRDRDRDGALPNSVFEPLTGAELAAWEGDG